MKRHILAIGTLLFSSLPSFADAGSTKPNVLFIAIDDLRDWVSYLGHNPQSQTPNIDRLAARGVSFTRSYCASPSCNPSRAALMSGMRPSTTGVYNNDDDWREKIAPELTLNRHFRANGYEVIGSGKIYHETFSRYQDWDAYFEDDGAQPAVPAGQSTGVGGIKFAPLDCRDDELDDWKIATYAIGQLGRPHDKPLFLACGFHKPHMPWNVPRKYYDIHPLDQIVLPPHLAPGVDLADVPPTGVSMAQPDVDHRRMMESGRWKEAVQGYLAAISYADMLVGRLLDALDASPMKDNTLICLWSDHGWNLGEKEHWRKFVLWEESTRSPLIWVVPGVTTPGTVSDRTVDLMSIYPTLCELCSIDTPAHVEGRSIKALLQDPAAVWDVPAVSTYNYANHAVRDEGWRYISYQNGEEELYNETDDPNEWTNLAKDPSMSARKTAMGLFMPATNFFPLNAKISFKQGSGKPIPAGGSKDFGSVVAGGKVSLPFTLSNEGTGDLTGLKFTITGAGAGNFRVTGGPFPKLIPPGQSTAMNIAYQPAVAGEKKAVLHISHKDSGLTGFTVKLAGYAARTAEEFQIDQPDGNSLMDGVSVTDFGTAEAGGKEVARNFFIKNTGAKVLTKLEIKIDGPDQKNFIVGPLEKSRLRPGDRTRFSVKFKPGALGACKAAIHIRSKDSDEAPFDIGLSGKGG